MIKDIGKRTAKDSAELTSILSGMILDAAKEPPYTSPYIRTATISYLVNGTWTTKVELEASPAPVPLADFVKKVDDSIMHNLGWAPGQTIASPGTKVMLDAEKNVNENGFDTITGSIEHQPTPGLTVRCIILMTYNKPNHPISHRPF